ncbi:MAG: Gfo/Idh/MocA family oxidoreductase [Acidobacteria bacterium]|nr:Gfo/Idh/MocA family oxidoreductase [Acidobacteriota bacterium]
MVTRRILLASTAVPLMAQGAVRGGIIGSGGRGRYLTGEFKEIGVNMAAVCDVYEPNLRAGLKVASTGAQAYDNYKKLLDDKSIQVVVVATPDHWHAQMVIDAVEAGKDVYVEKPLAHTIAEGWRMIEAVKRTKRIVQVGMQRRSYDVFLEAKQAYDTGNIGDVRHVNAWWMNNQASLNPAPLEGKLDWKQWLGTAPPRELDAQRFRNWYYFWDYSGGLMIGQAAHMVDAIHWLRGLTYPSAVYAAGVNTLPGAEVPETTTMLLEYPEQVLVAFTVGYKSMRYSGFLDQVAQHHGTKARFDAGREHWALYREDPKATELKPEKERRSPGAFSHATRQHIRNFLECVQTRQQPNAPVEVAQQTNVVLCMAIESLRSGKRLKWDAVGKKVVG